MIFIKIIALILLADFATGFFHFIADNYGKIDGKILASSINGLLIHHNDPGRMTKQSYWELTNKVYKVGIAFFIISLIFGFYWEILFFVIVSAQANIIHKWSHQKKPKTHRIISYLQKVMIIQSRQHHIKHHKNNYKSYYCVMTNFLNPVLEKLQFWRGVIWCLKIVGVQPVNEENNNDQLVNNNLQ